ncbi:MAG: hypothetical protein M0Q13_12450 [Methanothrix sp.]|nr:hypothetical protein [Methanothrix sp.]
MIYDGKFKYEDIIAHYNYILPIENKVKKYLKIRKDIEILQSKLRSFEKKWKLLHFLENNK